MLRMLRRSACTAVLGCALVVALVGYGSPAQAAPTTLAQKIQTETTGATTVHHAGQAYRISWSRAGGHLHAQVGKSESPTMRPDFWGCTPMVMGAIAAVGAVVVGILAAGGGPLDLGFLVIGPKTLQLVAAALGGIGTLESVVAEYIC